MSILSFQLFADHEGQGLVLPRIVLHIDEMKTRKAVSGRAGE